MKFLLFSALLALAFAGKHRHQYVRVGSARSKRVEFRVLLQQQRVEEFHRHVQELVDPVSSKYGEWMSREEITAWLSPATEDRTTALDFFHENGFHLVRDLGDTLVLQGSAKLIERTFSVVVSKWVHKSTKRMRHLIEGSWVVPERLEGIVTGLAGITHLPIESHTRPHKRDAAASGGVDVIPHFLRFIYNVSKDAKVADSSASLCLAEFEDYSPFTESGLKAMLQQTNEPPGDVAKIIGRKPGSVPGLESALDVQVGVAMARGATVWFWTAEKWLLEFSQDLASHPNPPQVISMSWGWPSNMMCGQGPGRSCQGLNSRGYVMRTETEWAKSAAMGITLLAASGDQGAPGDGFASCQPGLSDIYPGSSVYVTSVGATMLKATPQNNDAALATWGAPVCNTRPCADGSNVAEVVCSHPQALITSGGGFSDFLPRPQWQSGAVDQYLKSGISLPPSHMYNSTNRGFPDISAIGHGYLIWSDSTQIEVVDGTSCSTPLIASLITLANSIRMKNGKKTLGNVAPALYRAGASNFISITEGNNKCTEFCCSQDGWEAGPHWDPTTGRGVPDWAKLQNYLVNL